MKKVRLAVIGIGHLGSLHLRTFHELTRKAEVVGICDILEERTHELGGLYQVATYLDYRDLLGKVDAVSICTPTESHYEIGRFFLQNKVHVFIEKPIARTIDEAQMLTALAQENGLKLQIGHVERFNSAFQSIMHFTKRPLFIECHRLNKFPNRSLDIGVIMDLMIHDLDIILALNQCPIKEIRATGIPILTALEDIASVRITFENGCVANLTASRVSEDVMRKIRIFQKNTYISLDYVNQEAFIYKKHENQILKHSLPIEKEQPLPKELEHFLDCIIEDKVPYVTGKEGAHALKVALEIIDHIWKSRQTISL